MVLISETHVPCGKDEQKCVHFSSLYLRVLHLLPLTVAKGSLSCNQKRFAASAPFCFGCSSLGTARLWGSSPGMGEGERRRVRGRGREKGEGRRVGEGNRRGERGREGERAGKGRGDLFSCCKQILFLTISVNLLWSFLVDFPGSKSFKVAKEHPLSPAHFCLVKLWAVEIQNWP